MTITCTSNKSDKCFTDKMPDECYTSKGICLACVRFKRLEYQREYYKKNRERVKAKVKSYYVYKRRENLHKNKKGNKASL